MPDFSLVPVDHQPDFSDVSLCPVDHDPFGIDGPVGQPQVQLAQVQAQPAQTQPEDPPQQPAIGADQPDAGAPATGDGINPSSGQGKPGPAPFGGYANPTPTESLVNRAKMDDQEKIIAVDRTGQSGFIVDGDTLYKFVTTKPARARYLIDGNTGTVFTVTDPFYAYDGTRYATIDASVDRPVTVTVKEDGSFTISRP